MIGHAEMKVGDKIYFFARQDLHQANILLDAAKGKSQTEMVKRNAAGVGRYTEYLMANKSP